MTKYVHEVVCGRRYTAADIIAEAPVGGMPEVRALVERYFPNADLWLSIWCRFRGADGDFVALSNGTLLRLHDVTQN